MFKLHIAPNRTSFWTTVLYIGIKTHDKKLKHELKQTRKSILRLYTADCERFPSLLEIYKGEVRVRYKVRKFWMKSHCYIVDVTGLQFLLCLKCHVLEDCKVLSFSLQSLKDWAQTTVVIE